MSATSWIGFINSCLLHSSPPCDGACPRDCVSAPTPCVMLVTGCASPAPLTGHRGGGSSPRLKGGNNNNNSSRGRKLLAVTCSPTSPRNSFSSDATKTVPDHIRGCRGADGGDMGGLMRPSHHLKAPSAPLPHHGESFTERFSTMLDHCQKKIRLLQGPSALFTTLVTWVVNTLRCMPSLL